MVTRRSMNPMSRRVPIGSAVRPPGTSPEHGRRFPSLQARPLTDSPAIAAILIVDSDRKLRTGLATYLRKRGHTVETATDRGEAIRALSARSFDVVFAEIRIADVDGVRLLREVRHRRPDASLVLMSSHASVPDAIDAIRAGVDHYLVKPVAPREVELLVGRILEMRALRQETLLSKQAPEPSPLLDSANAAMQRAIATARQVATSDAAVLLMGESGTGKNVLAAAIHAWSRRAGGPFITIPCTTLADQLLETELFGHVKGAFTGAWKDKPGRLEAAVGGTLFLDEVGDLPLPLQGKLLRVLAEQRFERVGAGDTIEVDARIVAATNRELDVEVRAGRFREDLFFRLNVVTIVLPPLRERREDIEPLADHVLARLVARHGRGRLTLSPEVRDIFAAYRWPGNARELVNTLERAVVLSSGDVITAEHLPDRFFAPGSPGIAALPPISLSLEELERQQIERVVRDSETLEEAAERLGINPATLWRKRKRYGLHR
jgi:NtrC-family two-component system response regulator AlgB